MKSYANISYHSLAAAMMHDFICQHMISQGTKNPDAAAWPNGRVRVCQCPATRRRRRAAEAAQAGSSVGFQGPTSGLPS